MRLHEFQAKALMADYGIATPRHYLLEDPAQVYDVANKLGGDEWIVRAQVHGTGRGEAGGIHWVKGVSALQTCVSKLIGQRLYLGERRDGQEVNSVLIEAPEQVEKDLYFAIAIDRSKERVVVLTGWVADLKAEEMTPETPQALLRVEADMIMGLQRFQCRQLAIDLGFSGDVLNQFTQFTQQCYRLFVERELMLLEINPLALVSGNGFVPLDAKIVVDDNAIYRHEELQQLRDTRQEDPKELAAEAHNLTYVRLTGDIGCLVNGAGLAMATADLIKLHGGEPANFLDVGATVSEDELVEAVRLLLSDSGLKVVLINVFGGIVRCDVVATAVVKAMQENPSPLPIVVRFEGSKAADGLAILSQSGLAVSMSGGIDEAALMAVNVAKGKPL